jgi:hypothetical protein
MSLYNYEQQSRFMLHLVVTFHETVNLIFQVNEHNVKKKRYYVI